MPTPTKREAAVLRLLEVDPAMPQKDIAEKLGMTKQAVSQTVLQLRAKGFLTQTPRRYRVIKKETA